MPQIMGSGAALFDFNNDGLLDIYLCKTPGPFPSRNRLFKQLPGGRFEDVTTVWPAIPGYNMGVALGMSTTDGRPDVLVTSMGRAAVFEQRDETFTDVTAPAAGNLPGTPPPFSISSRWLVDLVVVNYVDYDPAQRCGPASESAITAILTLLRPCYQLFRNLGRQAQEPSGAGISRTHSRRRAGSLRGRGWG